MRLTREDAGIKTVEITIYPAETLAELRRYSVRIERMRRLIDGLDSLEVTYKSLLTDRAAETARLQPFRRVSDVILFQPKLVRITPDTISDVIENYGELADILIGTEFARILG
jgi:hypothetical protein